MRTRFYLCVAAAATICTLALVSCASTQVIDIAASGAGTADVTINLDQSLIKYFRDISASLGGTAEPSANAPVFDLDALRTAFRKYPNINLESAATPSDGSLSLHLSFTDIRTVLTGSEGEPAGFLEFTRGGGLSTLTVTLNRDLVTRLVALTPLSGSEAAGILMPPADYPMSASTYTDYLAWALGDYGTPVQLKREIAASTISVRINVPGAIVAHAGGTVSGRSVRFDIPVPELLTLTKQIDYSVTYR